MHEETARYGFDDPRCRLSDDLAARAEILLRDGRTRDAKDLFAEAAMLEEAIARNTPVSTPRVRTVLAVSAVTLWLKSDRQSDMERCAKTFLDDASIIEEGKSEIRDLLAAASHRTL